MKILTVLDIVLNLPARQYRFRAGYNDDRQSDGIDQNYWFAKITYKLQPNTGPTLFGTYSEPFSDRAFGKRDVKDTLLKKVRRNNKIMVERSKNGAFKLSGN